MKKENWQWPLLNYYQGFYVRALKEGDAVMLVEINCKPRNVIVLKTTDSGYFVGENDFIAFSCYGTTWKIAPPSASELDYPLTQAAWSEAVFRVNEEFGLDAEDYPDLVQFICNKLDESKTFIDGEVSSLIAKEAAEDYYRNFASEMTEEQQKFWQKYFEEV